MSNIGNVNLNGKISSSKILTSDIKTFDIEKTDSKDFKAIFEGLVENLNNQANAPDELLNKAVLGEADIHDVMVAIQKADIEVNLATTAVGKVIQAYEKISQISI